MRRAQLQQVFTFILIAVVIITTLFFAIRMIGVITTSSCEAQITSFDNRLDELSQSYTTRGTIQETSLQRPCDAQAVCYFPITNVNTSKAPDGVSLGIIAQLNSSASLGVGDNQAPANVFLAEENSLREIGTFENIITQDNLVVCTQQQGGRINLRFAGTGRNVLVSSSD